MTQPLTWPRRATRLGLLALVLAVGLLTTACERITPIRTLPSWVRGVYIPVFKNRTYEPQIEEYITRYTQEAFLADGRVGIVPKEQADAIVKGEIVEWHIENAGNAADHVMDREDVTIVASVKLYEPYEEDDQKPLADLGKITFRTTFNVDTRSINFDPEPDRKTLAMRSLAQQIMQHTITGFPAQAGTTPGVPMPEYRSPESIPRRDVIEPHVIQQQR